MEKRPSKILSSLVLTALVGAALVGAGCTDRKSGTAADLGFGPATDARHGGDGPSIDVPDAERNDAASDMALIDVSYLDAQVPPDAAGPATDAQPLPDLGPDDRDPLCRERPGPGGEDVFDAQNDCGGRNDNTIRSVRNPSCPDYAEPPAQAPGLEVVLDDVVVTAIFDHDFVVQDADGVAYNALWVHNTAGFDTVNLGPGTQLHLEGELIRFFDLDELVISPGGIDIVGEAPPIAPTRVYDAHRVADGGDLARALESRLVTLANEVVFDTAPDCPSDFGNFVLGSGLWVGGKAEFDYAPARGDVLHTVTGILSVSFDHRKIFPRNDADINAVPCGGLPDKCAEAECPVPVDAPETGALVVTEIQNNPSGQDALREYVELYNASGASVDLTGWWVQDCGGRKANLSGRLNAGDLLVLAASTDRGENGGVPADLELGEVFLPNGYGSVLVFNARQELVDQVRYEPGDPWPHRSPGESLELSDPALDNRLGESWEKGRHHYGDGGDGTPGELP